MNNKRKFFFTVILFVIIATGAGFYLWRDFPKGGPLGTAKDRPLGIDGNFETEKESKIEDQSIINQNQNTDSEINNSQILLDKLTQNIPKGTNPEIISQIQELSQTLKDNPDYLQGWLQLGILRKSLNDFEGAAEAWQYTTVIRPDSSTAYLNLGDLYGYYFHDNQKAEENLLKAIKIEPANIYAYSKTYEFYTDTNQPEKAREIIEQGIAANPNTSQSLQSLLNP